MRVIEIRPIEKFGGSWMAFEAPGVEPAFPGPTGRQDAIDYASNRFGGSRGEMHVYDEVGKNIAQKIPIDDRIKFPHAG